MTHTISLEQIRIASPCTMRWSDMSGDERVRHCRHCDLDVHDLSAMTRAEAEALMLGADGRVCARFRRRADGTVITRDCPVGAADARRRRARLLTAAGALLGVGLGAAASIVGRESRASSHVRLRELEPFSTIRGWFASPIPAVTPLPVLMGDICIPSPVTTPGSSPASPIATGMSQ